MAVELPVSPRLAKNAFSVLSVVTGTELLLFVVDEFEVVLEAVAFEGLVVLVIVELASVELEEVVFEFVMLESVVFTIAKGSESKSLVELEVEFEEVLLLFVAFVVLVVGAL